jgi:integrase
MANTPRKPAHLVLQTYAREWMQSRTDLAKRTTELYGWLLDRHIEPTFGSKPLDEIAPADIRSWFADSARLHATTAAKAYRLLSSIMKTAVADELIRRNPCQIRGAAVEKAPERPIATIAEVDALTDSMPPELQMAVVLAAWCQLRRGEVRGLRRCDVDLKDGTLQVRLTRTTAMSGQSIIKEPKTRAGRRTVAIPPHVVEMLSKHMDLYVGSSDVDYVFGGSDRSLSVAWHRARSQLDRNELRFHDLRHSGLTWSAATGASIAELMRRAGHASQTAALRYQHATDDRDRVLALALANLAGHACREQPEVGDTEHRTAPSEVDEQSIADLEPPCDVLNIDR